jgi:acyl carrier protein
MELSCSELANKSNRLTTPEEALNWICEIFEEAPGALQPETPREEVPMWDSMGVLALMAGMDEKFGVIVTDADIKAMHKVGDILAVLRKHGQIE